MAETVEWDERGIPRSPRFGDVYRTASGGLEQARHVFLAGCGLPAAWAGQPCWRILETGFGLGINFLAAWRAWKDDPHRPRLLHFVRPAVRSGTIHRVEISRRWPRRAERRLTGRARRG